MKLDWKKIAQDRQKKLKDLERICEIRARNIEWHLENELKTILHAQCVDTEVVRSKIKAAAHFVAERIRPKLWK